MRFAIASDDGTHVAQHFGRTRGFVVVSIDGDVEDRRYVENRFTQHQHGKHTQEEGHAHGEHDHGHNTHGHSHDSILQALDGCSMVVAGGMGMRLRTDLCAAGIDPYVTDLHSVDDVIRAVRERSLVHLSERSCGR
ncbi:MAG: iron-molybdenum cofactor biosynthesis protein [Bacteroidetes bacterium]|nr:iron-molybdenum cofactor biosynthesis protein [Bacteroidota bacterium]